MKHPIDIPIENNLNIACSLWYDVQAIVKNKLMHHVCPHNKCNSFKEAINYYFKHYYEDAHEIIKITHHGYTYDNLQQLSMCC